MVKTLTILKRNAEKLMRWSTGCTVKALKKFLILQFQRLRESFRTKMMSPRMVSQITRAYLLLADSKRRVLVIYLINLSSFLIERMHLTIKKQQVELAIMMPSLVILRQQHNHLLLQETKRTLSVTSPQTCLIQLSTEERVSSIRARTVLMINEQSLLDLMMTWSPIIHNTTLCQTVQRGTKSNPLVTLHHNINLVSMQIFEIALTTRSLNTSQSLSVPTTMIMLLQGRTR